MRYFHGETKFKQYMFINPAIQKELEGKHQLKELNHTSKEITMNKQSQSNESKEGIDTHSNNKITGINKYCLLITQY